MNLVSDFRARVRVVGVAALLRLAACSADEQDDDVDTEVSGLTVTTTVATATSAATTDPSEATTGPSAEESSSGTDPGTGTDIDYATDIQPIWIANCVAGCHEPSGVNTTLDLSLAFVSHTALTTQKPVYSIDPFFVVPGDAANSFLIAALRNPPGTIVRQMPLRLDDSVDPPEAVDGEPLGESTILRVEAWIQRGAEP